MIALILAAAYFWPIAPAAIPGATFDNNCLMGVYASRNGLPTGPEIGGGSHKESWRHERHRITVFVPNRFNAGDWLAVWCQL